MTRPTRRGIGLALSSGLLFLVGTNVQSGWLFVMASLLVGAFVTGLLIPGRTARRVEVERRAPAEAFAGEEVPVDLIVRNKSRGAKLSLTLSDTHIQPADAFVPQLAAKETLTVGTIRHAAKRGVVDGKPITVSSAAPFGVALAKRKVAAPGRTVVYPRVVPIPWMPDLASSAKPLDAAQVRSRKGVGQDYLGIREYQLGDSLRHVHWPSTARLGSLMVREFEQELPRRLGVVIDTWADTGGGETALDICASVAASVAMFAMREGHPMAMAAAKNRSIELLADPDRTASLTWLAELEAPGGPPMAATLDEAVPLLGRIDTLVVVFPTWRPNAGLPAELAGLTDTGRQVIAVMVDAGSFPAGDPGAPPLDEAQADLLAAELAAQRTIVYRVRAEEDLAECLQQAV